MTLDYIHSLLVCIIWTMVLADKYIMLLDTDPACNKSHQSNSFLRTVVDDVVLHEQLLFTWPNPPMRTAKYNATQQIDKLLLKACSGVLIRPSGRFVERSLSEGIVSFWLLRGVITLRCPKVSVAKDSYYVLVDQWIETSLLGVTAEPAGPLIVHNGQDSMRPVIYSSQPDKSVRLDCSRAKNALSIYNVKGYVRRVRLHWHLSGTLLSSQAAAYSSQPIVPGSRQRNHTGHGIRSVRNKTSWQALTTPYQPVHPDFGIQIRLTSRMLFQGNFPVERKRVLCEFFSGFWCPSSRTNTSIQFTQKDDLEACVQASMRCDRLPDCDPSIPLDFENVLSADETNCDMSPFNYSIERQERLGNLSQPDRWTSKLPWIVLAPVPLVLICALVRICSQKRHLDLAEEGDLNRWLEPRVGSSTVSTDGTGAGTGASKRTKLGRTFWTGKRSRHGPVYGPVRTLSSVPEVDEREVECRSSVTLQQNAKWTPSAIGQGDFRMSNVNNMGQTSTIDPKEVISNGIHSPKQVRPIVKSQSLIPLPTTESGTLSSSTGIYDIEHKPTRKRYAFGESGTVERRRTFLCWSTLLNPDSSSSSCSQSSPSSSSSCSNCRVSHKQIIFRSRSCDDMVSLRPLASCNSVELQTLDTVNYVNDSGPDNPQQGGRSQTHPFTPFDWSYVHSDNAEPAMAPLGTRLITESNGCKTLSEVSETSHGVTVSVHLCQPTGIYDDSIGTVSEHPLQQPKKTLTQGFDELGAEVHHTDPMDTRSGSHDYLLELHRAQSPTRDED